MVATAHSELHAQLRAHTRAAHEALHEAPLLRDLSSPQLSRATYVRILSTFHRFYAELVPAPEGALARSVALRLEALEADLEACSVSVSKPPSPSSTIRSRSLHWETGARYVIEGSTLGGTVLAKRVRKHLGPETPLQFYGLSSRGWPTFLGELTEVPRGGWADVISGANSTFDDLKRRFQHGE